jgi:hypothetical protein
VQEPRVRTGACVLTELSLLLSICVLKFSAMSRLQVEREAKVAMFQHVALVCRCKKTGTVLCPWIRHKTCKLSTIAALHKCTSAWELSTCKQASTHCHLLHIITVAPFY